MRRAEKEGLLCRPKGDIKREGKRERKKRERVKSHGHEKGGRGERDLARGVRKRVSQ